jgi:hypothetical protein
MISARPVRRVQGLLAAVVLASVVGLAGPALGETGTVRVAISNALVSPQGTSGDGQISLQLGIGLPVFLVGGGGAVIGGSIATATFARWQDAAPPPGLSSPSVLIVLHLPGGVLLTAAAVQTSGGRVSTFSATTPAQTLSGTWTLTDGSSVPGAGLYDAVVTFTFDTNPNNTIAGLVRLVARDLLSSLSTKIVQGVASVDLARDVPVASVVDDAVGPTVATLTSYLVGNVVGGSGLDYVEIVAIRAGDTVLLYACAFPDAVASLACLLGGNGPLAHLSGSVSRTAGTYIDDIDGVADQDLVLDLSASLP